MVATGIVIERVTDLDGAWPEIEAMFLALHEFHRQFNDFGLLPDWAERQRTAVGVDGDHVLLVARDHGEAVGFLNGRLNRNVSIFEETFGSIDNAYVRDEYRAKGIGRALVTAVEQWFRERGATELRLSVNADNALGRAVWEHLGFEPYSMRLRKSL